MLYSIDDVTLEEMDTLVAVLDYGLKEGARLDRFWARAKKLQAYLEDKGALRFEPCKGYKHDRFDVIHKGALIGKVYATAATTTRGKRWRYVGNDGKRYESTNTKKLKARIEAAMTTLSDLL